MASISSAWTLGRSPWRSPASRMVRDSSAVNTPVSQNTSQNSASPSRAARGIISWHSRRMYASRRPRYSSGRAWAPINVAASSTGCVSFSRRMTRSCFISCSGSRPYPLFASQVVTPIRSISARASAAFCASCSSVAARVPERWRECRLPGPECPDTARRGASAPAHSAATRRRSGVYGRPPVPGSPAVPRVDDPVALRRSRVPLPHGSNGLAA